MHVLNRARGGSSYLGSYSHASRTGHVGGVVVVLWSYGKQWTISVSPNGFIDLNAVSCATSTNCLVVGSRNLQQELAERWNGTKSTIVAQPLSPGVDSVLVAISCLSTTNCSASSWPSGKTKTVVNNRR